MSHGFGFTFSTPTAHDILDVAISSVRLAGCRSAWWRWRGLRAMTGTTPERPHFGCVALTLAEHAVAGIPDMVYAPEVGGISVLAMAALQVAVLSFAPVPDGCVVHVGKLHHNVLGPGSWSRVKRMRVALEALCGYPGPRGLPPLPPQVFAHEGAVSKLRVLIVDAVRARGIIEGWRPLENLRSVVAPGCYPLRAGSTILRTRDEAWASTCFGARMTSDVASSALLGLAMLGETHKANCSCDVCATPWANPSPNTKHIQITAVAKFEQPIPCREGNCMPVCLPPRLWGSVAEVAARTVWRRAEGRSAADAAQVCPALVATADAPPSGGLGA